ncbi:MAG: hypothetical protein WAM60_11485, partial [Candidatus Promineifilaceae bacterium]
GRRLTVIWKRRYGAKRVQTSPAPLYGPKWLDYLMAEGVTRYAQQVRCLSQQQLLVRNLIVAFMWAEVGGLSSLK